MEIDWDTPCRLESEHIMNMAHTVMPAKDGSLRSCVRNAMKWPDDAIPTIFADKPIMGSTVLDRSAIRRLAKMLEG